MRYKLIISHEAFVKIVKYQKAIEAIDESKEIPGTYLREQLIEAKFGTTDFTTEDFIAALVKTKKPRIVAEREVFGDGRDWNQRELGLLGDLNVAVPVTIYDNGLHQGSIKQHESPILGTLLFTPGAFLQPYLNGYGESPDLFEVVKNGTIDRSAYYNLYERRLLPLLIEANQAAAAKKRKAFITIPGLGCGQFAGQFRGTLGPELQRVLRKLLQTHGEKLHHIQALRFDPYEECQDNREKINGIDFITRPLCKSSRGMPQLCSPVEYQEVGDDFSECELFSVVEWDPVSWPGNDFFENDRVTDDGVKAAATNVMEAMTGVRGSYQGDRYLPPPEYNTWNAVVEQNVLHFDPHRKIFIVEDSPSILKLAGDEPVKPLTFLEQAKKVKEEIRKAVVTVDPRLLAVQSSQSTPYRNPITTLSVDFSEEAKDFLTELDQSAKLMITPENYKILGNYFEDRKKQQDKLGKLYSKLNFEQFILRLLHKRYKEVYLDGTAVVPRDDAPSFSAIHDGQQGRQFLDAVGSVEDTQNYYQEYLTLEEMVLTPLVLPQVTSLIIGTGNRSPEESWDVTQEFKDSIDVATFSCPAAPEFRDGRTRHYDFLFIVKPTVADTDYQQRVASLQKNAALVAAARSIYGENFAFEKQESNEFISLNTEFSLHRKAYLHRTKGMLKLLLVAADQEMAAKGLGKTFQLKGLGLDAFSFADKAAQKIVEGFFVEALKRVLNEIQLTHIDCVNLINLPTAPKKLPTAPKKPQDEGVVKGVKIIRSNMDPTSMSHAKGFDIDIGGTVFCGDSGSLVGNEGNMGLDRSSSDNLATQYSLWDPQILAPKPTARLPIPKLSYGSIFVCGATPGSLKPLSLQPFPVAASGSQKKPDSSRQGQNTAQPPFKQPADPAFALFQELYFNYYKGEFFTNPYSTMRQKLRDNEISTLAEVRAYALEHPGTRTVKVLKIFDALQEVNPVDDLQPFKTNYWQAYNSTFFHNPYSKMRTLLLSDETHPVTMDDIKKQVINDPHSRSAKVLCGMKK